MLYSWLTVHFPLLEYNFQKGRDLLFQLVIYAKHLEQFLICCMNELILPIFYVHVFPFFFFFTTFSLSFHNCWQRMQPQTIYFFPNLYFTSLFKFSSVAAKPCLQGLLPAPEGFIALYCYSCLKKANTDVQRTHHGSLEHLGATSRINNSLDQSLLKSSSIYWLFYLSISNFFSRVVVRW